MPYRDPRIDQDRKVMVVIGARFASRREGANMTEKEFADGSLGTTEAFVKEFERGEAVGNWATVRRWARILGFEDGDLEQIEFHARREDNAGEEAV